MKRRLVSLFVMLAMFVGCLPTVVWAATGNDIANAAWNYLGVSRDVYDCSAFTQKVYSDCGISIPRLTYDQANCGTRIYSRDVNDLKPGDIVCFGSSSNSSDISHVGIYVGNNVVLHSSYSKWQIAQDNMSNWITTGWYTPPYQFAVRVISVGTPPTNARISVSSSNIPIGSSITFTCSANNATGYTIGIDKNGTRITTKDIGTSYTQKFTEAGTYTAYVSAWNSVGLVDSSRVSFTVYGTPTNPKLSLNKTSIYIDESITFTCSANNATGYTIGINKNGTRITTKDIGTSYTQKFTEAGTYTAYVSAWNSVGLVDSSKITFVVLEKTEFAFPFTVTKNNGSATITNNTTEQRKACVIVAKYSGGILLDTDIYNTVYIAPETPFKINTNSSDYKVFVWDSLSGMKPLAEQ